ncbi:thioesterase II family protein [Micromonospora echinofusca]|uniref:Thioesterase n=1 Tax=Micromonospora echinofusca TaxID=47858 RepID=A0ABS3VNB8_MICEH|nr:alpha/beta fold hydrolase [Micromonospora echinofusca]MBO4206030.1 thioesterase [Micromonospora echinofusca]
MNVRLFCLPYAGGSARIYAEWDRQLPDWIDVTPVELPGRGLRFHEPVRTRLDDLVADVHRTVTAQLDGPFAVFGHSLGAMLGFELVRLLAREGRRPEHFYPSGAGAPHLPTRNPAPQFSDAAIRSHLAGLGGTPRELVENDELMDLMMPVLRADFGIADTYRRAPDVTVDCPTTAFGGVDDPEAPPVDVLAWRRHVRAPFAVRFLPGDHFFVNTARSALLDQLIATLQADPTRSGVTRR